MRTCFIKKVVPPQTQLRNQLLRKLVQLRSIRNNSCNELKQRLRKRLKSTDGRVEYYYLYNGFLFKIGSEKTKRKEFLSVRTADFSTLLRQRRVNRQKYKSSERYRSIAGVDILYQKTGGVIDTGGVFLGLNKQIRRKKVFNPKVPTTSDDYVGIEMEFASALNLEQMADCIADAGLQDVVRAVRDGSITTTPTHPFQVELCILTKFADLKLTLERVKKIAPPGMFDVNPSCGLHVHLDGRNSSKARQIYQNLVSMQSVLFSLVDESRRDNRYCHPVSAPTIEESDTRDHYAAISSSSYKKHKTIEVRIHHSTLDFDRVEKWVRLLKRISDYSGPNVLQIGTYETEYEQLVNNVAPEPDLIEYVNKNKTNYSLPVSRGLDFRDLHAMYITMPNSISNYRMYYDLETSPPIYTTFSTSGGVGSENT